MTKYVVRQMTEGWLEATVEAGSEDEAIALSQSNYSEYDWSQADDGLYFTDKFEVEEI